MSDGEAVIGIVVLVLYAVLLAAAAVHAPFRRRVIANMIEWAREMRRIWIERPLRLITGRRRPDHARIAELERSELR